MLKMGTMQMKKTKMSYLGSSFSLVFFNLILNPLSANKTTKNNIRGRNAIFKLKKNGGKMTVRPCWGEGVN